MGASFGRTFLGPEENSPPNSRDEWRLRRDDPRLELILAERASVECHAFDVSGLRARFALPIPRVVYPAGCRVPCLRVAFRALLRAQVRITEPGKQMCGCPAPAQHSTDHPIRTPAMAHNLRMGKFFQHVK